MTKETNTTATFAIIENGADLDAAIKSISNRGKKLDRDIWQAAVSAIWHHAKHGDSTKINRLIDAMPKGARVNALKEFFQANSGCDYDEQSKTFQHTRGKEANIEAAMEASWVEYKPEQPYRPFDALAAIKKIVKQVQEADPSKGDKCTDTQKEEIMTLAAKLGVEVTV